jgi:hypothetical protein
VIGVLIGAAAIVGAVLVRHHAPAVTLALVGAVGAGFIGFEYSANSGRHGVPQDVAIWACFGLAFFGLLGLVFLPGRPPARWLWRAAIVTAVAAPFAGLLVGLALVQVCPLYVTDGAGYCHYEIDLMGGWASAVAAAVGLHFLGVAFLFGTSAWQAGRSTANEVSPDALVGAH